MRLNKLITSLIYSFTFMVGIGISGLSVKAEENDNAYQDIAYSTEDDSIDELDESILKESGNEWLELNEENFPDEVFRKCLTDEFDSDGNGKIDPDDITNIGNTKYEDGKYICYSGIKSLKGIEYFEKLRTLDIRESKLTDLDISDNKELECIGIFGSNLKNVDLSNNVKLNTIRIVDGKLESIDVSKNVNLELLFLSNNNISNIDLSNNKNIYWLAVDINPLIEVDIRNNPKILDQFSSTPALTIDETQKVISSGKAEHETIMLSSKKGYIDLDKYSIESSYLNGIDEAFGSDSLSYNKKNNILYYDFDNIYSQIEIKEDGYIPFIEKDYGNGCVDISSEVWYCMALDEERYEIYVRDKDDHMKGIELKYHPVYDEYFKSKKAGDTNTDISTDPSDNPIIPSEEPKTPTVPVEEPASTTATYVSMYRMYNPNSGEHFYTAKEAEKNNLVNVGWRYEGIAWNAPNTSDTPVYRLYNPNAGDHHYTTNVAEKDNLVSVGWNYEGIGWYSTSEYGQPLYRLYNPNAIAGAHHYTTSVAERDHLISVGWNDEGIAWYGGK